MQSQTMLQHAALTDRGKYRKVNEDAYGAAVDTQGNQVFCVADGMGGHEAGDVASRVGVDAALDSWRRSDPGQQVTWRLAQCVNAANDAVLSQANQRGTIGNMGSTIVLLAVHGNAAYLAHAGDSRIYLLRGGHLEQLTRDHTEAAERIASGQLDAVEADKSPYSHMVTRGLGLSDPVVPDFSGPHPLAMDDTFLLCSDGLTGVVDDGEVSDIIRYHDLSESGRILVKLANNRGGPDNITVQLVRVGARTGALEPAPAKYRVPYGPPIWLIRVIALALLVGLVVLVTSLVLCTR